MWCERCGLVVQKTQCFHFGTGDWAGDPLGWSSETIVCFSSNCKVVGLWPQSVAPV